MPPSLTRAGFPVSVHRLHGLPSCAGIRWLAGPCSLLPAPVLRVGSVVGVQNILFGPSSTLPCLQKQSGCQAERMVLAARYPSRWAMRPHLLRIQMHRMCKEQRGQAEGGTYFETSCFRLPDCMHAQALCAVADSFAATQHHQPPVEHWRYSPLDLTFLSVLRSA